MTEQEETEYHNLQIELHKQFPNCPFDIECVKHIKELDEPITQLTGIIIKDDRANEHNFYYHELPTEERNKYINYLGITRTDKPITLRQIINAMISSPHYNNDTVKNDDHSFLEGFDISENGVLFTASFGS